MTEIKNGSMCGGGIGEVMKKEGISSPFNRILEAMTGLRPKQEVMLSEAI